MRGVGFCFVEHAGCLLGEYETWQGVRHSGADYSGGRVAACVVAACEVAVE